MSADVHQRLQQLNDDVRQVLADKARFSTKRLESLRQLAVDMREDPGIDGMQLQRLDDLEQQLAALLK